MCKHNVPFSFYIPEPLLLNSTKVLGELISATHNLSNYTELVSAVSEVSTKLMDATAVALASQEKQSALSNRISELENQLRQIEDWESQIKRYKLHEFPTGALAYMVKPGMEQGEPLHYLCATCVNKRKKSVLQPIRERHYLKCDPCNTEIQIVHSSFSQDDSCPNDGPNGWMAV